MSDRTQVDKNKVVRAKYAVAIGVIGLMTMGVKGGVLGAVVGWFGAPKVVRWLYS